MRILWVRRRNTAGFALMETFSSGHRTSDVHSTLTHLGEHAIGWVSLGCLKDSQLSIGSESCHLVPMTGEPRQRYNAQRALSEINVFGRTAVARGSSTCEIAWGLIPIWTERTSFVYAQIQSEFCEGIDAGREVALSSFGESLGNIASFGCHGRSCIE